MTFWSFVKNQWEHNLNFSPNAKDFHQAVLAAPCAQPPSRRLRRHTLSQLPERDLRPMTGKGYFFSTKLRLRKHDSYSASYATTHE